MSHGREPTMMPDWRSNRVYLSSLLSRLQPRLWKGLTEQFARYRIDYRLEPDAPQIWVRDFLPVQVEENAFVAFRYQPDYLRGGYEDLLPPESVSRFVAELGELRSSAIRLDGGNVIGSTTRAVLTEKVYQAN